MVVALRRASGKLIERPSLDVPLHQGDTVIVIAHAHDAPSLSSRFTSQRRQISYRGVVAHR
jgi:voltage-gated potassium channel